ncbi:MAG: ATP-binding protein [Kofleriaceae bacterium]
MAEQTLTELEAAERALALSRARLDYSTRVANVGFWYCDLPFDVLQWDERVKSHFWLPPDAVVTIGLFYEIIHPDDREMTRAAIDGAIGDHRQYDVVYRTVDPVSGAIKSIRALGGADYADDGTPIRFDGVTVDVTEQKRVEQRLRDQDRAKDEFLATLAHELRNPLAPIRSGLDLLELDRSSVHADRAIATMKRQLGHMVRMVDDLLDISRVTLGKITLEHARVDLKDAIASALETTRSLVDRAQVTVHTELPDRPLLVDGDATRLAQVFANLVNNATKYTPSGGTITLSATVADERVVIRVSDTGKGIPHDMLESIFDMFTQLGKSIDRQHDGLGIGLTLVRKIVELHGGTVVAEPVAHGATIAVTLPLAIASVASFSPPKVIERTGLDVLVVDDNQDAGEMLGLLLEQRGNRVRIADDGPTAIDEAKKQAPDVVILDIGLPTMSGYEVARAMRAAGIRSTLIALTGWGADRDRAEARSAGFDHHLVKPVDFAKLTAILSVVKP